MTIGKGTKEYRKSKATALRIYNKAVELDSSIATISAEQTRRVQAEAAYQLAVKAAWEKYQATSDY